jgi:methionyl-tRNA formyltransferase
VKKIIYFGTPVFAAEVLAFLLENKVPIAAVVTQPDRPKGRSHQLAPSPVKELAMKRAIPIFQPEKASTEDFIQSLRDLNADLFVVVAYGQILSQKLLDTPPMGCINVHASLLPKYRGAAPMQRCLMAGEKETGIAIQKMVKQLDAGDVIATTVLPIPTEMTHGELDKALCDAAKPLLLSVIQKYDQGIPPATPQDSSLATFAPKVEGEQIDWSKPATEIHNLIRALSPKPGAWTTVSSGDERKKLKILRTKVVSEPGRGNVPCNPGYLQLVEVQPEGKKVMPAADWLRGQKNNLIFN